MNMKKYNSDCFSLICSKMIGKYFLFGIAAIAFSCAPALYIPTASRETASATITQLQAGRALYVEKCGSCHALVLPEKHSKQEWKHFLDEMQQKASINDLQKEQILLYLSRGN
jgi:hypothetical protein